MPLGTRLRLLLCTSKAEIASSVSSDAPGRSCRTCRGRSHWRLRQAGSPSTDATMQGEPRSCDAPQEPCGKATCGRPNDGQPTCGRCSCERRPCGPGSCEPQSSARNASWPPSYGQPSCEPWTSCARPTCGPCASWRPSCAPGSCEPPTCEPCAAWQPSYG